MRLIVLRGLLRVWQGLQKPALRGLLRLRIGWLVGGTLRRLLGIRQRLQQFLLLRLLEPLRHLRIRELRRRNSI